MWVEFGVRRIRLKMIKMCVLQCTYKTQVGKLILMLLVVSYNELRTKSLIICRKKCIETECKCHATDKIE